VGGPGPAPSETRGAGLIAPPTGDSFDAASFMDEPDRSNVLAGARGLLVFHSFKHDVDTLAFIKNVRHLGVVPPLNLLYLSSWLRRHGARTEVLDCSAENLGLDDALARVRGSRYDFVCFSITNLDFLFAIEWVRAFSRALGCPVLVGGAAAE